MAPSRDREGGSTCACWVPCDARLALQHVTRQRVLGLQPDIASLILTCTTAGVRLNSTSSTVILVQVLL